MIRDTGEKGLNVGRQNTATFLPLSADRVERWDGKSRENRRTDRRDSHVITVNSREIGTRAPPL